jgi:thiamine kinase-like enzyme
MKNEQLIVSRPDKQIYRDGDSLVKVFGDNYSKSDILNEALNHARVEESTDLNVSKIEAVQLIEGKWAIKLSFIEGQTLEELMAQHPEKEAEYLNLFVDLQREILSKRVPLLTKLKDKMQGRISATSLDATTRYDLHTRLDSMREHKNLCHGDFNPSNIIIAKDGTPYVIDWSHATQGNASADVARTYLLFYLQKKGKLAEKYLDLYCKKSDTAKQYVQKWIPLVAAARLTKSKAEEKEFLLKWIDVVDYE